MACKYKYKNNWYSKEELKSILLKERGILPDGKLVKPEIKKQEEGNWEVESKKFKEKEDAIKYVEDIARKNPDNPFNPSVFDITWKFSTGKQPKFTRNNTTSIESVKSNYLTTNQDINNNFIDILPTSQIDEQWLKDNNINKQGYMLADYSAQLHKTNPLFLKVFNTEQDANIALKQFLKENQKEYTQQAETNLKIAALKETARKYPRSLITSKVVPINPNMVDNSEIQYSKRESIENMLRNIFKEKDNISRLIRDMNQGRFKNIDKKFEKIYEEILSLPEEDIIESIKKCLI